MVIAFFLMGMEKWRREGLGFHKEGTRQGYLEYLYVRIISFLCRMCFEIFNGDGFLREVGEQGEEIIMSFYWLVESNKWHNICNYFKDFAYFFPSSCWIVKTMHYVAVRSCTLPLPIERPYRIIKVWDAIAMNWKFCRNRRILNFMNDWILQGN